MSHEVGAPRGPGRPDQGRASYKKLEAEGMTVTYLTPTRSRSSRREASRSMTSGPRDRPDVVKRPLMISPR